MGATLPFTTTQAAVAAPSDQAGATAPACGKQSGLNDPTNSKNQVLTSYWFEIDHQGQVTAVCGMHGKVQTGDVVTVHFTLASPPPQGSGETELTLLSQDSPAASPRSQTLFQCSSYTVSSDPDADPCATAAGQDLTVTLPPCGYQIDFIYGETYTQITEGQYAHEHRFINGDAGTHACAVAVPEAPWTAGLVGAGGVVSALVWFRRRRLARCQQASG